MIRRKTLRGHIHLTVWGEDGWTIGRLAVDLGVSVPAMTRQVYHLRRQGLIAFDPDEHYTDGPRRNHPLVRRACPTCGS